MSPAPRRLLAAVAAAASLGAVAVPAAQAAQHTQSLDIGAQLVRQPPGKPWVVNLLLGATLGMDDGSLPTPVNHMVFSFTAGAKVHADAFKVCPPEDLDRNDPGACPKGSHLGTGTALAGALGMQFHAKLTVFNGPGTASKRTIMVYAQVQELSSYTLVLKGTLRKTSGRYGYVLDMPVPPIRTVGEGNDGSLTNFSVTVGGYGRLHGKKVPYIEAPTSCSGAGWPFQGKFTYTDGTSATAAAHISCLIQGTHS